MSDSKPFLNQKNLANQDFDWENYLLFNPDLGNARIDTQEKALQHWLEFGIKENRYGFKPSEFLKTMMTYFDWEFYISANLDLQNVGIQTKEKALQHWLRYGLNEHRPYYRIVKKHSQLIV